MKVKLKRNHFSKKFGIVFPKNVELKYSSELKCVEHNIHKNIWMKVKSKDFVNELVKV